MILCMHTCRATEHPKIEVLWDSVVAEAQGNEKGLLAKLVIENVKARPYVCCRDRAAAVMLSPLAAALQDKSKREMEAGGLFFAIGHEPATKFLNGQLKTDADGYILTEPGTTKTSVPGVFAAGDVQDRRWRQAITAAASGCMAALSVEHFLSVGDEAEEENGNSRSAARSHL